MSPKLPFGRRSRPKVFVTRELPGEAVERLRGEADVKVWKDHLPPPREELLRAVQDVEGLLSLLTDTVDDTILAAPKLRIVSNMAVGYDNIDVDAATRHKVLVANTPGILTETTADFAFALMLAAARRVAEGDRAVRQGHWQTWHPSFLLGRDVHGATLGIVGLGQIGQAVARRGRGFGMRVIYHSRTRRTDAEVELGVQFVSFDELLGQADFITVHIPSTPETRHLFDEATFARMKPNAVFINTSRGSVVDEVALHRALETKRIAAAAIDVAETEPLPEHDPLLRLPNLLVTPHIGSASIATRTRMAAMAVENLLAGLRGKIPTHCVNSEVLA